MLQLLWCVQVPPSTVRMIGDGNPPNPTLRGDEQTIEAPIQIILVTMDLSTGPPTYIFPILKSSEILQCLSEIEVPLTKQELTEPARHKEKLRGVFLAMVRSCQFGTLS